MKNISYKYRILPALDDYSYLDELKLYYAYFGSVPSVKRLANLDLEKLATWIETEKGFEKKHYSSVKRLHPRELSIFMTSVRYYVLDQNLLIKLEEGSMSVLFETGDEPRVDELLEKACQFRQETTENEIHMVIVSHNELSTEKIKFQKPDLVLDKHYNDDLKPVHEKLVKTLSEGNKSGLILLYGEPGTGKSTYIRSLICGLNKNVIFMTPELAGSLGSPEISKFLIRNAESVFVIEDAEQLLVSRDTGRSSSISTILNLTDGILGESLGIQIIATFNSDLYNIDKALLRKGRMLALYEFKPLEARKSASLLSELGMENVEVTNPMTLADIYNYGESTHEVLRTRTAIGFKN
ncbi:MAG TPA: AAA family ATPase [Chitinophagaceae bacterium]|nr:AAA family ATPase [Chitinophagaceae bacterium]